MEAPEQMGGRPGKRIPGARQWASSYPGTRLRCSCHCPSDGKLGEFELIWELEHH